MSCWLRFINKTEYDVLYFKLGERNEPVLLCKNDISNYFFTKDCRINIELLDKRNHHISSPFYSLVPNKLNTVILSQKSFF